MKVSINLAYLATVPLTIWMAATGRINWWIFVAVWCSHLSATISFRR